MPAFQQKERSSVTKHIGIVGCSAEGAALCYRTICIEAAEQMGDHAHPEITMHTFSLADYMRPWLEDDFEKVAQLMLWSAEKVAGAGADFLICPDNTIHEAFDRIVEKSPLPWLHIAEVVGEEAVLRGYKKLAVLGTKYLMTGPVYSEALKRLDIEGVIPDEEDRQKINDIIFRELVYANFQDRSREYFYDVMARMKARGCDAAVLGCTEIPLIVRPEEAPLPVLDSTRLLARAALKRALE
jgi:aspartate racemase